MANPKAIDKSWVMHAFGSLNDLQNLEIQIMNLREAIMKYRGNRLIPDTIDEILESWAGSVDEDIQEHKNKLSQFDPALNK